MTGQVVWPKFWVSNGLGGEYELSARLKSDRQSSFDGATMHTPIAVTDRALEAVGRVKADCVVSGDVSCAMQAAKTKTGQVAIGGGSTIGLGKAITYRTGLSLIVIPTTYAGSEATPILGQTVDGRKTTLTDTRVLPRCIIYDVTLTSSLPWSITVVSGINALAHCVEALYSVSVNPIITAVAAQGISGLTKALIALRMDADDLRARGQALTAAWSAGICLGAVGMGIHHKLCHTLGGSFGLPHAETHTVILPHAMAYNADHARDAMEVVRKAMDAKVPAPLAVWELERGLGTVLTLKEIGMKEEDIEKAADLAMLQTYPNPAPLERSRLVELLRRAFHGLPPA